MEMEHIELIADVPSAKPLSDARVKNSKKILPNGKMCTYYKNMECRAPFCDMDVCQKCPEGGAYCTRVAFIKKMITRVLIFIVSLLIFADI